MDQMKPMPGSQEAREGDCSCPSDENQGGDGAHIVNAEPGKTYAVVMGDCPMHGWMRTS